MDKKEIANIYKAINRVSNRLNEMSEKLDSVIQMLNAESNRKILINGDCIDGLAELVSTHDSALDELATLVSTIGGEIMVNFFEERIINGLKKWTDVPELWNKKVIERLQKDGYVLNEDGTVERASLPQ
mgnify:CR=1 FL=1